MSTSGSGCTERSSAMNRRQNRTASLCASRRVVGIFHQILFGYPDPERIPTPYVERQNLTLRMQLHRFTRLTNAFSKKLLHLKAALSVHFAWYNFIRIHQTLRVTPPMQAGVSNRVWKFQEILASWVLHVESVG